MLDKTVVRSFLGAVLVAIMPGTAMAATNTYDLVNYPILQDGYELSGTVTTDGTMGALDSTHIISWTWHAGNAWSASSSNPGGSVMISCTVEATPTSVIDSSFANHDRSRRLA